jgi:hypothetical protein
MRVPAALALGLAAYFTTSATRVEAQAETRGEAEHRSQSLAELTATPEAAAELYIRSVRAIRWSAAAQFLAPGTLDRFRTTVTMIADADTTGAIRSYLVQTDSVAMGTLSHAEVFDRAIGVVIDDMPGLMHALYDRDDEVIGHVLESPDSAHVVYRTTARLSGALSEVKVMQLERGADGWRVLWSDELDVLDAALRGVGR